MFPQLVSELLPLIKQGDKVLLKVKVTPKASRNLVKEISTTKELKVYVTEAAEKGKANQAVIDILAKTFNTAKSDWSIVKGELDRHKLIEFRGNVDNLENRLREYLRG